MNKEVNMEEEKTPPMFVEGYDGNDYGVDDLWEGIQWLLEEYNTRDPEDGTYWEQYTLVRL